MSSMSPSWVPPLRVHTEFLHSESTSSPSPRVHPGSLHSESTPGPSTPSHPGSLHLDSTPGPSTPSPPQVPPLRVTPGPSTPSPPRASPLRVHPRSLHFEFAVNPTRVCAKWMTGGIPRLRPSLPWFSAFLHRCTCAPVRRAPPPLPPPSEGLLACQSRLCPPAMTPDCRVRSARAR